MFTLTLIAYDHGEVEESEEHHAEFLKAGEDAVKDLEVAEKPLNLVVPFERR